MKLMGEKSYPIESVVWFKTQEYCNFFYGGVLSLVNEKFFFLPIYEIFFIVHEKFFCYEIVDNLFDGYQIFFVSFYLI